MAHPDRKGGGGLSLRTLSIASAASLTAAMVTKHFFPPGTIYASALTPIIVAAVSEMLNRPAERVSELRRQRRTLVYQAQQQRVAHGESTPLRDEPGFPEDHSLSGAGVTTAPLRIERPRRRLRDIHPRVWIATGVAAFVIAVAVLTLPELIFGGAVASNSRTTFFGGGTSSQTHTQTQTSTTPATTQTQTTTTVTQTVTTPTTTTGTATSTTPTGTDTTTTPSPSGGAPAPTATTPTTTTTTP